MDNRPIGVFDSGLGGLTVVKEIKNVLPKEKIIYLGDTARIPYGTRSKETIIKYSLENINFLKKFDIKCLVIACNTASAWAYSRIKNYISVPVVDMINPGASGALNKSLKKKIGVIGTKGTILSSAYKNALKKATQRVDVYEFSCPLFVPLIEEGETSGELISLVAKKYLSRFDALDIDTLILGCTHYPIISRVIKKEINYGVTLVNPGAEAAKFLYTLLVSTGSIRNIAKAENEYYLTDLSSNFINVAERYLGERISNNVKKVSLDRNK